MGHCNNPHEIGILWGVCNDKSGASGVFFGTEACIVGAMDTGESMCGIGRALNKLAASNTHFSIESEQ